MRLTPLPRQDTSYGDLLREILEAGCDAQDRLDPIAGFGPTFPAALERQLARQFGQFQLALARQPIRFDPALSDEAFTAQALAQIQRIAIDPVLAHEVEDTPFFNRFYRAGEYHPQITNAFWFQRIAAGERAVDGNWLPYTLRLMVSDPQRARIYNHYQQLGEAPSRCLWYQEGRCRGLRSLPDLDGCMLESGRLPARDLLRHAEEPFGDERDFVDASLASGALSYCLPYPDFSRTRRAATLRKSEVYNRHLSKRAAATSCLTLQALAADPEVLRREAVQPKAVAVPIQVCGITTAAILVVALDDPQGPEKTWIELHGLTESALLHTVNGSFRYTLKQAFLEALSTSFEAMLVQHIRPIAPKPDTQYVIDAAALERGMTQRLHLLARCYPCPLIDFSGVPTERPGENLLTLNSAARR